MHFATFHIAFLKSWKIHRRRKKGTKIKGVTRHQHDFLLLFIIYVETSLILHSCWAWTLPVFKSPEFKKLGSVGLKLSVGFEFWIGLEFWTFVRFWVGVGFAASLRFWAGLEETDDTEVFLLFRMSRHCCTSILFWLIESTILKYKHSDLFWVGFKCQNRRPTMW